MNVSTCQGDLGSVVYTLGSEASQSLIVKPKPLTIKRLYDDLISMTKTEGKASMVCLPSQKEAKIT